MAQSKTKVPPASALPTSTKDPPEALLWAYQLRREHGYLLSKIDAVNFSNKGLDVEHKKLAVSNLELWASNQELSASLKVLTEENVKSENRLQAIETAVHGLSNKMLDLKTAGSKAVETLDELWEAVREEGALRALLKKCLDSVNADHKTDKEERTHDNEVLRGKFGDLRSRVRDLERRIRPRASLGNQDRGLFEAPRPRQPRIPTTAPTPMPLPRPEMQPEPQLQSKLAPEAELAPISRPEAQLQPKTRHEAQMQPKMIVESYMHPKARPEVQLQPESKPEDQPRPAPRLRKPRRVAPSYPTLPTQQPATYAEQSSLFQPQHPISPTEILNGIHQGDLDLESYLNETGPKIEMIKRTSKPEDAEQRVVYAFLRGLERNKIRGGLYMQLQGTNFTWNALEKIVRAEVKTKENPVEKELPPLPTLPPPEPSKGKAPDLGYARHDDDTTLDTVAVEILDAAAQETLKEQRERTKLWTQQRRVRETRKEYEGPSETRKKNGNPSGERKRRRDVVPDVLGPDSGVQTRARAKVALTQYR